MFKVIVRRLAVIATVAFIGGLVLVPTASAITPPVGSGSTWACSTTDAGYTPEPGFGGPKTPIAGTAWVWDGRLSFEFCVVKTSSGSHYGLARLTSPGPASLSDKFDTVWAVLDIRLVTCAVQYLTVAEWNPNMKLGTLSGSATSTSSRYKWAWTQTPLTNNVLASYRVQVEGSGYVYQHDQNGWYFSLGAGMYPPSPNSYHTYRSSCLTP